MPEIYSGNKILFALLVDGTINSSGIFGPPREHVPRLFPQPIIEIYSGA